MKTFIKLVVVVTLAIGTYSDVYAYYEKGKPLLCALQDLTECVIGDQCQKVTPEDVNLPDFILVDHTQKLLTAVPGTGSNRKTPIDSGQKLDGRLILQGVDYGFKDQRDGLAWSISIDEINGKFIVSAAGDGFALVAFGACLTR